MKRVWIAILILIVALAGVIGWLGWQVLVKPSAEPVYKGKRLSEWLKPLFYMETRSPAIWTAEATRQRMANEAVLQAGTNAIPTLLRLLQAKDSPLKTKLLRLVAKQHVIEFDYTPACAWNNEAELRFEQLGPCAQSAVPALIEIANQNISMSSQALTFSVLGSIGPSAEEAVPMLLHWATNTNEYVRSSAIGALGMIHSSPDQVVPVLLDALQDLKPDVRYQAANALGEFGYDAIHAVPVLVALTKDPDEVMRKCVAQALKAIDPEAAAKAGVTNGP
jgi:HEAT repeat protein